MQIADRVSLWGGKRLPFDAEVEYLESTGTQWIEIGMTFDATCVLDMTFQFTKFVNTATCHGQTGQAATDTIPARFAFGKGAASWNDWYCGIGDKNLRTGTALDLAVHRFVVDAPDDKFVIDDTTYNVGWTSFDLPSNPNSAMLCNRARVDSATLDTSGVYGKLYCCKIWQNGVLVHNFIPVRKGNVGYLYDRVTRKLFGSAGTGDFVPGQDVVPVEYIESHGTEWIDTGTPTADKYVFECLFTNATRDMKLFGNSYAYGRYRDLSIYNNRYRGTSIATSSNEWDRIEIDVSQRSLTVTRNGSTFGPATNWWAAYTGATPDTQYGTALPLGGHVNAYGTWYGSNKVACFTAAQGVSLRTRLFESWSGSEPIEKLISVRVGTEGAMMDVLTRRIYRNAGTGAFAVGPDAPAMTGGGINAYA